MAGYSALIRTFNSQHALPETLMSLRRQTAQPDTYVIVDSGSTDKTLSVVPTQSIIHRFVGAEFNYSDALNQGVALVPTEYVLILSAHTSLNHEGAIEYALNVLDSDARIGAAYFSNTTAKTLGCDLIDKDHFNGFNGLWNTCSLVRVELLRQRGFRPEVFTAEDQEWARWLIGEKGMLTACITGAGMDNERNPNLRKHRLRKKLNEHVAIAYYSNPKMLGWPNIGGLILRALSLLPPYRPSQRAFYGLLSLRLAACHFAKPTPKARYF